MEFTRNDEPMQRARPAWQRALNDALQRPLFELTIGVLIIVSVALTMTTIAAPGYIYFRSLNAANDAITWVFVVELSLRLIAASNRWRFFREYWIDILATLPLLRVFPMFRALRLLRLLRMLRVMGLFSRYASSFPQVFRRGAVEYFIVGGLVVLTVVFGTGAILAFEREVHNEQIDDFGEAFWFSVFSLVAGEPIPERPNSTSGRVVAVAIMFMNLTLFAMFTGTFSAFMVERLRNRGRVVDFEDVSNHIIICGWSPKAEIVVHEYYSVRGKTNTVVVVIADPDEDDLVIDDPNMRSHIHFLRDDFTRVSALEKAGIRRAETCIILSDVSQTRTQQDADARTILAALTVEKLNPDVYTCAELHNREFGTHLEMGNVNDYVVSGEHSGYLLAQAAINRGMISVFRELWTFEHGNQFYRTAVPDTWAGKTFLNALIELKESYGAILIGIDEPAGGHRLNPDEYTFAGGENIIYIADREVSV